MSTKSKVLIVDDTEAVRRTLVRALENDYECEEAADGIEAMKRLENDPLPHLILLDWMMPNMSGIEVIRHIKNEERLRNIPVVMQTSRTNSEDIIEGMNAGAYYYLTKPFTISVLRAIVNSVITEYRRTVELVNARPHIDIFSFMHEGTIRFKTIEEGASIANSLAVLWGGEQKMVFGLQELITNAVEHGSLGIGYNRKSELLEHNILENEIAHLFTLPEYRDKYVEIRFKKYDDHVKIWIKDQGNGFDSRPFMKLDPERAFESHGRGILMAMFFYSCNLKYLEPGNEVMVTIPISQKKR